MAAQPRRCSARIVGVEALGRQAAPVGVVHRQVRAPLVVLLGLDRLRDQRMLAVGADHDPRALGDRRAALGVPADAGHRPVVSQDLVDGEALAQLRTRLDGGIDQQLVEHRAARAVAVRDPVDRLRRPGDRQRSEVEGVGLDRRAAGRLQALQQSPALERSHARRMHQVGRHRVARKGRLVDQQHPVALAGQQHRGGRSRAARSDDDRVISSLRTFLSHRCLPVARYRRPRGPARAAGTFRT